MKTIRPGKKIDPPNNWWVGQQSECTRCGAILELEDSDQVATLRDIDTPALPDNPSLRLWSACPTPYCFSKVFFSKPVPYVPVAYPLIEP